MPVLILLVVVMLAGCQTVQPKPKKDAVADAVAALGSVTEGLTNQDISPEDLKKLAVDVERDPHTRSAVTSINKALSVQQTGIKYCPKDGQRFDASVEICPIHKVKLELVE